MQALATTSCVRSQNVSVCLSAGWVNAPIGVTLGQPFVGRTYTFVSLCANICAIEHGNWPRAALGYLFLDYSTPSGDYPCDPTHRTSVGSLVGLSGKPTARCRLGYRIRLRHQYLANAYQAP